MSNIKVRKPGLRILVLEGAGARGLSQLKVLTEIMNRVQEQEELNDVPRVHEWFEFIAGVDTAALIAVLVGRLRMSVEDATNYFRRLGSEVYAHKAPIGIESTQHKTSRLVRTLKDMMQRAAGNDNEPMLDTQSNNRPRTLIFAMSQHNMNAGTPKIFRSYQAAVDQMPDCAIWQAVAASMAHPVHFKPIPIGGPPLNEYFVAGSVGCSNPTAYVLEEVRRVYPDQHVACIVVIGAGHPRTIQILDPGRLERILKSSSANLVGIDLAIDAERVARDMSKRFLMTRDFYFRLSVDQGMQEIGYDGWGQESKMIAHTRAYMRKLEVNVSINRIVEAMRSVGATFPTAYIDGEMRSSTTLHVGGLKMCPAPTPVFTGRQDVVDRIVECISHGGTERRVFILFGLGGAGKTQLALKTVEQTRDTWTDVIFVDATSHETATAALTGFAKEKGIGDSHESALRWLGSRKEKWLMVIDNADNPNVTIRNYFPSSNTGSILITTRIEQYVMLAQGDEPYFQVSGMRSEEAMALLMKTAQLKDIELSEDERSAATQLLEGLGYLALAIVQAGAYILCSKCRISEYLDMFMKHHRLTLEKSNRLPIRIDDYQKSVYTTWHLSYMLVSNNAQRLLQLMAFMHHNGIVEDIFRQATAQLQVYQPAIPETETEVRIRHHVTKCLRLYTNSTGTWDSSLFQDTMTELLSYSLISYDRVNGAYSLHVLVHDWAGTVVAHPIDLAVEHTALLLALSIDYEDTLESLAYKRMAEVHVTRLLERQPKPSANNAIRFGHVYYHAGRWKLYEEMEKIVVDSRLETLGGYHILTLGSINNLALAYQKQGRYKEAAKLQEQVVKAMNRLSGGGHSKTLTAMQNLARTYYELGRYSDAESLQLQTMQISTQAHGDCYFNTLFSMHELAITYKALGRYGEAEEMLTRVVDASKRVRGDEHPYTLSSMHALASAYRYQGRYDEAESLQMHVLEVRKRRLGDDHPETLAVRNGLASIYYVRGRYAEAEVLQSEVLDARMRAYGAEHPDTLTSMNNLANTYYSQGRYDHAEELGKQAVYGRKRTLGISHPHTLQAMRDLLLIYESIGESRRNEYRVLEKQINEQNSNEAR